MSSCNQQYHVIVWGATGFTGSLCCDYIAERYTAKKKTLRWAIAGRSKQKLEELRDLLCTKHNLKAKNIDVIVADIRDRQSLDGMCSKAAVVLSTAGPFDRIGEPIVAACVRNSCNYVDITGEPRFVRRMIDKYHDEAVSKKIKIVPCCGFDCIPVDVGCSVMVKELQNRGWVPKEVRTTLTKMQGGASGGTISSIANALATTTLRELREALHPYFLCPRDPTGEPIQPSTFLVRAAGDKMWLHYDPVIQKYCVPFIMQAIDTRVVNRSNAIGGSDPTTWKYGRDFVYQEDMASSPNFFVALLTVIASFVGMILMYGTLTRALLLAFLPKPGQGPDKKTREEGFFFFKSQGKGVDPKTGEICSIVGSFNGPNGDGGYKQTSIMVVESALCLALQSDSTPQLFGILTPSTAFGGVIIDRLKESPGITFDIEK